jgi:hypothetical protein
MPPRKTRRVAGAVLAGQAGIARIRNAQDLRNRLGGGTLPDSLTRAATPLRIPEVRQARAAGSPAPCRKAELRSATTFYNINWINWLVVGFGFVSRHYIPRPTGPIYRGLTTTMSAVSLGWTQEPPGGLRGEQRYILREPCRSKSR